MRHFGKAIGLFFKNYIVATALGFATYLLINATAMWISVFTIMPVVAALLIRWYLVPIRCSAEKSLREASIGILCGAEPVDLALLCSAALFRTCRHIASPERRTGKDLNFRRHRQEVLNAAYTRHGLFCRV